MKLFKKILVANRGEIAIRVMKSARKLLIPTVAIYAEPDRTSLHVRSADEAVCIGGVDLSDSYLNADKIIQAALKTGCDAIHPGYGFLSESPVLVAACLKNNIAFIGPHTKAITLMGNKIEARKFVEEIGIPMTKGITGDIKSLFDQSHLLTYPVLVKAAAGGGGKGMRIVRHADELKEVLESTSREAKNYFGDETIYIEQYIEEPRHIEIQLLGDNFGHLVHLYERECSIQRRYQKIIEESPSPTLTSEIREKMGEAAVNIGRKIGYNSAGTIEFLVDKHLNFYFLEMNTRIQVEHPVTEMVTGIDLVEEQILVAAGNPLRFDQQDISQHGHAIECRIYAEDPANHFLPSPGDITLLELPVGENVRIDTSIDGPTTIQSFYDPMISKLVVWAPDRAAAIVKTEDMLKKFVIQGIQTNIPYLLQVVKHEAFIDNHISTKFCDTHSEQLLLGIHQQKAEIQQAVPLVGIIIHSLNINHKPANVWETIGYWRNRMLIPVQLDEVVFEVEMLLNFNNEFQFLINNQHCGATLISADSRKMDLLINQVPYRIFISENSKGMGHLTVNGVHFETKRSDILAEAEYYESADQGKDAGSYYTPMPGKVIKVSVKPGDEVARGSILLVVEAMKMENNIVATHDATIEQVNVKVGDMVDTDKLLIKLHDKE
ncbi:MAG: biotin carboxylase N-terminal domain-containing protein [Bacteroidales bacterium]|nr:biotin carboxylase N-terminal domain-containing protein [Bacteroidales bacterium]